jgi:uncharacterized protein (UPF0548 family)
LRRPTTALVDASIAAARESQSPAPRTLSVGGPPLTAPPLGYVQDFSESQLGKGSKVFAAAREAILRWTPFDLGWVRVANSSAPVRVDEIIAVEIRSFGLWSLNLSRVVDVLDAPERFGFVYSTTGLHVEEGEEKFHVLLEPETDVVWYRIEAFSRPRHPLVKWGNPAARQLQHRFVRESHKRMRQPAASSSTPAL